VEEQKFFDGSICLHCYYKFYNDLLGTLLQDVKHQKFV